MIWHVSHTEGSDKFSSANLDAVDVAELSPVRLIGHLSRVDVHIASYSHFHSNNLAMHGQE